MNLSESEKQIHLQVRKTCGFKVLTDLKFFKFTGKDASSYIQTQTSNDVLILEAGKGHDNALLDRKGHLKGVFSLHKLDTELFFLAETKQGEIIIEHLDNFHFTEDFEMEELTEKYNFILLQGKNSAELLKELIALDLSEKEENSITPIIYQEQNSFVINKSYTGEKGFLLILEKSIFDNFKLEILEKGKNHDIVEISDNVIESLRIEAGTPKYQVDFTEENLIPETGFEKTCVSYSKGCYLGQEVVARIKTYGTAPKAIIGLEFEGSELPDFNASIFFNDKNIGVIKSTLFSPSLEKAISLAYLHKDYRKPDEKFEFTCNDKKYNVTVRLLPFYKALTNEEMAKMLYEKALMVFAENQEEEAVTLLEQAITYKKDFPDAYESLGVILSRLEKYEEAIQVMNKLTEVAPNEPMARTNLSIFYMKIGNKDEAEKQMAIATTLKFKKAMEESKYKKAIEAKKKEEIEAIKERMEMFIEVLETEDAEDLIANYGLGKSYFDLEEYTKALPYFQKAIEVKKDYSMAYLYLGKALEFIEDKQKALETYKTGITVASQKGDLMPLKEMEQRKLKLEG